MNAFARYTLARLGLFLAAFALTWLVGGWWLDADAVSFLWTALVALVVSAIAAAFLLRGMREELAAHVQARAERMTARIEESRRAEDVD